MTQHAHEVTPGDNVSLTLIGVHWLSEAIHPTRLSAIIPS